MMEHEASAARIQGELSDPDCRSATFQRGVNELLWYLENGAPEAQVWITTRVIGVLSLPCKIYLGKTGTFSKGWVNQHACALKG